MAATAQTKDESSNVVSLASKRRSLFTEVAVDQNYYARHMEMFDVSQLVIDSCATRADLRIIEDSDDEVEQCLETRIDTLLGVDWRLEGGSETVRDWLTEQVKKHYTTIITNAFAARLYGYSVQERVWAKQDGYFVVDRVSEKPFEWFTPKRDGTLWFQPKYNIIITPTAGNQDYLDGLQVDTTFKFLLTRHKPTWKNPRGKALLAYLFWPWFYRKATWQFWMQFLERTGQPLLVGKGNDPQQMAEALAKAVQDAVIGIPINAEVDAVSTTNKGEAFNMAEDRLVRRIQKVLLGQTLTSDSGGDGKGAKALGVVHNEVRLDKTIGDINLLAPVVQNFVDALLMLNFPSSRPIKLVYAIDRGLETGRATRDTALINSGNLEFTDQYFKREYGFKDGDITVQSPTAQKQLAADTAKNNAANADTSGSDPGNAGNTNSNSSTKGA